MKFTLIYNWLVKASAGRSSVKFNSRVLFNCQLREVNSVHFEEALNVTSTKSS